jgi:peptidoglycan/LPS O-acetylase OafA/YrhL
VSTPPEHSPSAYRLGYRADIEGLRAVAILLVIAAHAKMPWLAGGFVGVDVFFVLSGYLITGLLVQEIRDTGGLRLMAFYARRLRRLLPALLLMLVGTSVAAMVLLAPFEQREQVDAAGAASLWLSNMFFAVSQLDYFGPSADTNLFLHTWSLGVEEQFYLVWPALVLFLLGAWRWQGFRKDWSSLRPGLAVIVVSCLALSIYWTYTQPALAFYSMPSRAWQFGLGALTFLLRVKREPSDEGATASRTIHLLGWAGLVMILTAALLLDSHTPYPGGWAVLPALGTACVLYAGAHGGVGRMLSLRPMQSIGSVSYAWYLWHWPVLLLGATLVNMHDPLQVLGLVLLSLAFAVASRQLVENPVRRNPCLLRRPTLALVGGLAVMAGAYFMTTQWQLQTDDWVRRPDQRRFSRANGDVPKLYAKDCDSGFNGDRVKVCKFGDEHAAHTALVVGDSIALQWFPALVSNYARPGWRLLVITKSACPMVDVPFFYQPLGREFTECERWRSSALAYAIALKPDVLILGSGTFYDFTPAQWMSGTHRVLGRVADAATGGVFLMLASPTLPFDGPACLSRASWRPRFLARFGDCTTVATKRSDDIDALVRRAAERYPQVHVVDMRDAVCPGQICRAARDGMIVFRDAQHLTASFAGTLSQSLARELQSGSQQRRSAVAPATGTTAAR